MQSVVIVAAGRSAIGSFGGSLSSLSAVDLGSQVISQLISSVDIAPEQVDEVILGQVLTAGCGQNPARQSAIKAGLPVEVTAMTINKVCGSGLKAIQLAAQAISAGDADCIIAGGQESMSQAPHAVPNSRNGQRMGEWNMVDTMIKDGLWDAFNDYHMGITAENIAEKYDISREDQDSFAIQSHLKATNAQKEGVFAREIIPISVPQRKRDPIIVDRDECPREGLEVEALAKLRAAFKKDGSVSAGNASSLNDGAAAVIVCSESFAQRHNLPIRAKIKSYANAGVCPTIMGTGPVPATQKCLDKAGWSINDLDLIEANEAFAVQALAVGQGLQWESDRVNVNGGAIALGHPIGASGCRVLVTLLHEMERRDVGKGLATLCIGGGMGTALALER